MEKKIIFNKISFNDILLMCRTMYVLLLYGLRCDYVKDKLKMRIKYSRLNIISPKVSPRARTKTPPTMCLKL